MKVLAIIALAVSSVSALGSGPYLPSGWRPDGPAFYLPSEVARTEETPLKDTILQESEAAGSEFLKEYGPPKIEEVSQDITIQSLPEVATEKAFILEAKFSEVEESSGVEAEVSVTETEVAATEGSVDLRDFIKEEIVTEKQDTEEPIIQGKSLDEEETTEQERDITTERLEEIPLIQGKSINFEIEAISENAGVDVSKVEENTSGVTSIDKRVGEVVVESENNAAVQEQISPVPEVKADQEVSGSLAKFPEGFLEYGPPGFREYGPPKGDELLRTVEDKPQEQQLIESNETRRRRFSPKFKTVRSLRRH